MQTRLISTIASVAVLAFSAHAKADSLTPSSFSGSVSVGGTISVSPSKVGTVTAGTPTTASADVLFVTDTTGSMGPAISEIQSSFSSVVSSLAGLGNVATGAAQYKDATNAGDPFDYQLTQAITTNPSQTQTAINSWTAGGGGDDPEQALYALTQASTSSTGWQTGAKKIAVIVGDAPSHSSPDYPFAAGGANVTNTAAALVAAGVTVVSLNASNITGDTGLNDFGQFSGSGSIYAAGVNGSYTASFPNASMLASTLESLIGDAFSNYSDVSLDLIGPTPTNCTVSLPSAITGSFNRSSTQTFDFGAVDITGTSAGTCAFTVALEADGAVLATESDSVLVGGTVVPEPASLLIFGGGLIGLGGFMRRRMIT